MPLSRNRSNIDVMFFQNCVIPFGLSSLLSPSSSYLNCLTFPLQSLKRKTFYCKRKKWLWYAVKSVNVKADSTERFTDLGKLNFPMHIWWVNFINILWAAFMLTDPKSAKRQSSCKSFCALGISTCKSCS